MKIYKIILAIVIFVFWIHTSFAAINMTVSPIKYELEVEPWTSITRTATLYNYDPKAVKIITAKSDFTSGDTTWWPKFVRYSELIHPDQQLSKWISLSSSGFTIPAAVGWKPSKKVINFTIDVPENATPWWHYAAVFFKNNNSEQSSGSRVSINADYGVIVLLKVAGEVVTNVEIQDPIVSGHWWGYSKINKKNYNLTGGKDIWKANGWIDNCLFDLTNSNFDGKCIDDPEDFFVQDNKKKQTDTDADVWKQKKDDFEVTFEFPIKNTWNIHVKPTWKIKLIDEDWKEIKKIWKKAKLNKLGAVIWVDVVDYIPVNDGGGNVLAKSQRNFIEKWEWFPYQTLDNEGKIVMKNMSPEQFYTNKNIGTDRILKPWERVCYRKNNKTIKALISLNYKDDKGENVEYSSAKDIEVSYEDKYIWINWYIVFIAFLFLFFISIFLLLWFIALWKRRKCINKKCRKKIKRKLIRCPHCDTKQKKSKKKKK